MSLENLIKDCKKFKPKAQSELYEKYKDDLYVLCLKYCSNKAEAEDNLQDAFIEIFRSIKKYKNIGSFEAWMKRICINKAIDKYRKQKLFVLQEQFEIKEEHYINDKFLQIGLDKLLAHIQNLPNQYRLVFNLYQLDDYSHKDIAQLLNISESTSKSNLHRAKSILKKEITKAMESNHKLNLKNGSK